MQQSRLPFSRTQLASPPPPQNNFLRQTYQPVQASPSLKILSQPSNIPIQFLQPHSQINRTYQPSDPAFSVVSNSAIRYTQPSTSLCSISRYDQPLQVVELHQVEEPWKQKVSQLEAENQKLREENLKLKGSKLSKFENEEEESELSQAYSQIQQLVNTIKNLQDEIQSAQENIDSKENKIDVLERQLELKEKEIEDLNSYVQELNQQLEDCNIEEKQKYLFDEVNTWKKKFIEQNKEFHQKQEEYMMLQAELDNLRNTQVVLQKNSDYKNSSLIK